MGKKKQFQKPVELSDDEIFVDAEAELEKEAFKEILKAVKKEQVFNEPQSSWFNKEGILEHRLYLCIRYELDYNKPVGINSETCQVFNFDFNERQGKTLPEYIGTLGCKWENFINYDLAIEGSYKDYILKY